MRAIGEQWPALAALGVSLVLGVWVDPILGETPWWDYEVQSELWVVLGPPLAIWLFVALAGIGIASARRVASVRGKLLVVSWVLATSMIAWVLWVMLLVDAFPASDGSQLAFRLALVGVLLGVIVSVSYLFRPRARRIDDAIQGGPEHRS